MAKKQKKIRTPIPEEVQKAVLEEAGERCCMPDCGSTTDLVIHHIDGNPSNHDLANLLVMCAVCHGRTNTGEIDRKTCKAIKRDVALKHASPEELERVKMEVAMEISSLAGRLDEPRPLEVSDKGSRVMDFRLDAAANHALVFEKEGVRLPGGIVRSLVESLYKAGASDKALAVQEALMAGPDVSPVDHFNLGILLSDAGRESEASSAFRAAMDEVSDDAEALSSLAAYLHDAERKEAEDAYRRAIEADPEDSQWHNSLAYYLWEEDRPDESEAEARRALEINPNDAYANATLGLLLLDKDDLEGGKAGYEKAVELKPDDLPLLQRYHYEYGRALGRNGHTEDARLELQAAQQVDSKYVPKERIQEELSKLNGK